MPNKLTQDEFIARSKIIHNNFYDYSLVKYTGCNIKVKIVCPKHGIFEQIANAHIRGGNCRKCGYDSKDLKLKTNDIDFIIQSNKVHNNKYNYSLMQYKNTSIPIKIICPIHGVFSKKPQNHLHGSGCKKCYCEYNRERFKKSREDFIKQSMVIHGNLYNYDKFIYTNGKTNGIIVCSKHGDFLQSPNSHINSKCGCPKCKVSKGEKIIYDYLKLQGYLFDQQKTFEGCKGKKRLLPFDFYLSNYNIAIEYQGEQHFKPIKGWGGDKTFERIKYNDNIKKEYCKKNNIYLIEMPYYEKDPINFLERCVTHHLSNKKARE